MIEKKRNDKSIKLGGLAHAPFVACRVRRVGYDGLKRWQNQPNLLFLGGLAARARFPIRSQGSSIWPDG